MKKNKISKNWINKQKRDIYVRKSKIEGYRSRAVYKLDEINKKFNILKNGFKIIDLGAAPGSWSQYLSKNIKNGKILSIDLKEMEKIEKVHQIKGDFTQINQQQLIGYNVLFKNFIKLLDEKKLPNKMIISGPRGIGKSTFAYHFINYIFSKNEKDSYV